MAHDMKLVINDAGIRCILHDRIPERLPHIHGRQFNVGTLLLAQRLEKQVYVGLFPAFATDPYWTSSLQIADDNPVVIVRLQWCSVYAAIRGATLIDRTPCHHRYQSLY